MLTEILFQEGLSDWGYCDEAAETAKHLLWESLHSSTKYLHNS